MQKLPRLPLEMCASIVFHVLTLIATLISHDDDGQMKRPSAASTIRERMGLVSLAAFPGRLRRHLGRPLQMEPIW